MGEESISDSRRSACMCPEEEGYGNWGRGKPLRPELSGSTVGSLLKRQNRAGKGGISQSEGVMSTLLLQLQQAGQQPVSRWWCGGGGGG